MLPSSVLAHSMERACAGRYAPRNESCVARLIDNIRALRERGTDLLRGGAELLGSGCRLLPQVRPTLTPFTVAP